MNKINNIRTNLEINCCVGDFLCPQHWFPIDFNVNQNCTQTFMGRKLEWNLYANIDQNQEGHFLWKCCMQKEKLYSPKG